MARTGSLASTAALGLVVACAPPSPRDTWTGEFVTAYSDEGVQLCGGTQAFFDGYVENIGQYWTGGSWSPPPERFTVELRATPTTPLAGRATGPHTAWAGTGASLLHELTHIVTWSEDGLSSPALVEGVAEGLGPSRPGEVWADFFYAEHPDEFSFLPAGSFGDEPGEYYSAAAQTVAGLARRYGISAVRTAYQLAPRNGTSAEIEAAYAEAFGDELSGAFDEIAQERPCGFRQWQCDEAVVSTVELPFGFDEEQTAACADENLIGAELSGDTEWYPEAVFALEFDEETSFMFEEDNAVVYGYACREACEGPGGNPPDVVYPYVGVPTTLPAGRYFFRVRSGDRVNPFSFSFSPV